MLEKIYFEITCFSNLQRKIILVFLQCKEFELFWALSFFKVCSHIFMIFEVKLEYWFFFTLKQEVERKSELFCGVNFFRSNFKAECENGVGTKIRFLGSGFLFTCGNFTLMFTVFSIFLDRFFFLNCFPNPFRAHSRPTFLFELNFYFSLVVFLFTCCFFTVFFEFLNQIFFLNCFPNPFIAHSGPSFLFEPNFNFPLLFCWHVAFLYWFSVFLLFWSDFFKKWFSEFTHSSFPSSFLFSQQKFFELYIRTCPAMFF